MTEFGGEKSGKGVESDGEGSEGAGERERERKRGKRARKREKGTDSVLDPPGIDRCVRLPERRDARVLPSFLLSSLLLPSCPSYSFSVPLSRPVSSSVAFIRAADADADASTSYRRRSYPTPNPPISLSTLPRHPLRSSLFEKQRR